MAKVTFKHHGAEVARLLKSPEVQAVVLAEARKIAARAGPGMEASSSIGRSRARATVHTATLEAILAEAIRRRLSSALRGG